MERISVLAVDITERKQLEEMLRQKARQYESFMENMKEGFIVLSRNMTVVYVNDTFCRLTLYEKQALIGNSVLPYFDSKNRKILKSEFQKLKQGRYFHYILEFICKDEIRIHLRVSPKTIFDSNGNFQGSFAVITDITNQKQTENRRNRSEGRKRN